MNPNEEDPPSLEQASTVLDALKTEPGEFQSNRPVTVMGPSLRFSAPIELTGFEEKAFADRYTKVSTLGEGGMGEVRLCHDARIGRDVAMKVIRIAHGARADYRARFLREVRVQGQLEHPSIVPVYDLGIGTDGATYFTMKRVRGLTLADIFDRLRSQDPEAVAQYTQRRLLAAFQSVCLAVEFAHSRGVIHRDLKPQNVMLGDFGEVYVLDWGIAKIVGEPDDPVTAEAASQKLVDSADNLETQVGTFVGSLGYLSPEQFSGEDLDGRADVFSLGAILFETLCLRPLFEGSPMQVAQAIAEPVDARCSVRAPDHEIPPELEQICVVATQLEREGRYESPRQLNDAIGRFLDGDRDLERRKILATNHLELAEIEIDAIQAESGHGVAHRAKALGELGRALALDPTNETALGDIVALFLEPPAELPKEVRADMAKSKTATVRSIAITGVTGFPIGLMMLMPVLISMGITNWTTIAVIATSMILISILCALQIRSSTDAKSYMIMTGAAIAFLAVGRIFGPLVLLPQMAMSTSMIYSMHPTKRVQLASSSLMALSIAVPLFLERIGILPPSYVFRDGQMIIVPNVCDFTELTSLGLLAAMSLVFLLMGSRTIRRIRNALTAAEEQLSLQAWQLRQLVPERARRGFRRP